ncbi:MAG: hypothetical protein SGBAC_009813 [Bacillariaceae sp.]
MSCKPGELVNLQLSKSEKRQDSGLKLEERENGKIYIRKVTGLVKRRGLPVEAGDQLTSLDGVDVEDMAMSEMKRIVKDALRFNFSIRKYDPNEEEDDDEEEAYKEDCYQEENGEEEYPDEIRPGCQYILEGIKLKEYNGELVEVIQAAKKKGKWEVEVLSSQAILAVREEKLVPVPHDYDYDDAEEEGGGEELDEEPEEEEPEEEDEDEVEEHMLSVEGYIIQPGDTMKLRGIKKKAKMNGTIVSVLKLSAVRKEWKVELPDGSKMSVAGGNLRHVQ